MDELKKVYWTTNRQFQAQFHTDIDLQDVCNWIASNQDIEPENVFYRADLVQWAKDNLNKENFAEYPTAHLNDAGGWCSPEHGNTCGYHPEHDS